MMRPWNFSAGPSVLPVEVLERAAAEMLDWQGSGMSVMEMSHRGKEFMQILQEAEADLRELLQVPEEFAVLFTQGGAQAQNAIVPMNLLGLKPGRKADYIVSGNWSSKAQQDATQFGHINVAASSGSAAKLDGREYKPFAWFPAIDTWHLQADASYIHVCSNETIGGVEHNEWPRFDVPLVVDASSNLLSRPFDFSAIDMLYAGAQKNAGPAGLTLIVIRKDLLGAADAICPNVFNYEMLAANQSMVNTPATYSIYVAGLVYKWLKAQGGVAAIEKANVVKAETLYGYLDQSDFYVNAVQESARSRMNVPFQLRDAALDAMFLAEADQQGLLQLKGHKSVGGMRASIYNAMPVEGVQALVAFMKEFEQRHG